MKKDSLLTLLVPLWLCLAPSFSLAAQDSGILRFGQAAGWKDFVQLDGVGFQKARDGSLEMTLGAAAYQADDDTDLLLHFDDRLVDAASRYRVVNTPGVITRGFSAIGGGSAVFRGSETPVIVQATAGALFSALQGWRDFSLEFWLYPAQAYDGETVLSWQGGRTSAGPLESQRFQVDFQNSKLTWTLQNLFAPSPSAPAITVRLQGRSPVLPRQWHHHLLRFQAATGLLEYLVDGQTEDLRYVTPSGREDGRVLGLVTGPQTRGELVLGSRLNGALDELRLSRHWIDQPQRDRYTTAFGAHGTAISRVIDLKYAGSAVETIQVRDRQEGNSAAFYSYRMSDTVRYQWTFSGLTEKSLAPTPETEADSWIRFTPGQSLLGQASGRYLQIRVDLRPSGTGVDTPRLAEMVVKTVPSLPPPPPAGLEVIPGDQSLTLRWKPVLQGQVDGYLIFFGTRPGEYLGTVCQQGTSPLTVKGATSLTLTGLANDQIYYVSVAAFHLANISVNSRELAARPQRSLR